MGTDALNPDALAVEAKREAARAKWTARFYWCQVPAVGASYVFMEREAWQNLMLIYLALLSVVAAAATYESKAKGAEAKAAGYENP